MSSPAPLQSDPIATSASVAIRPGEPFPLGATCDARGTNFAVFSEVAERVGPIWGFDADKQELRNMWSRTRQPGLWFTGGSFSQCRIYSRFIALQIDAIEAGRLEKSVTATDGA